MKDKEEALCKICMRSKLRKKAVNSIKKGCVEKEFDDILKQIIRNMYKSAECETKNLFY